MMVTKVHVLYVVIFLMIRVGKHRHTFIRG